MGGEIEGKITDGKYPVPKRKVRGKKEALQVMTLTILMVINKTEVRREIPSIKF